MSLVDNVIGAKAKIIQRRPCPTPTVVQKVIVFAVLLGLRVKNLPEQLEYTMLSVSLLH